MKFNVIHRATGEELTIEASENSKHNTMVLGYWSCCGCANMGYHTVSEIKCDDCGEEYNPVSCSAGVRLDEWLEEFDPDFKDDIAIQSFELGDYFELPVQELKVNDSDSYDHISILLDKEQFPIAYKQKVLCLLSSGSSLSDAVNIVDSTPIEMELYYERGSGLMAIESEAVEAVGVISPYSGKRYSDGEIESVKHNIGLEKKEIELGTSLEQRFEDYKLLDMFCYGGGLKGWITKDNFISSCSLSGRECWDSLMGVLVHKIESLEIVGRMGRFRVGAINFDENYTGYIEDCGNRLIQCEGKTRFSAMYYACMLFVKLYYTHQEVVPEYSGVLYEGWF